MISAAYIIIVDDGIDSVRQKKWHSLTCTARACQSQTPGRAARRNARIRTPYDLYRLPSKRQRQRALIIRTEYSTTAWLTLRGHKRL